MMDWTALAAGAVVGAVTWNVVKVYDRWQINRANKEWEQYMEDMLKPLPRDEGDV